ncbi:MAG: cytochrome c biogenesis protein [Cytophagaceae bacterium]|nr:cytochrome c biogenesis protein [Cytophagaceae bacterium]
MNIELKKKSVLNWWKILAILLLFYTVIGGLLMEVPRRDILNESIRNLYFHVPMWFGMIIMLTISAVASIGYLSNSKSRFDIIASEMVNMGAIFGILGLITGMLWAEYTWGKFWSGDPKQKASVAGLLIYFGYMVLRASFSDDQLRARVSAVFSILAYPTFIVLIFVLPRLVDSLHPGNGGNPGFNAYDLDARMRMVFYPAVIAFSLLGVWIATLRIRIRTIDNLVIDKNYEKENSVILDHKVK